MLSDFQQNSARNVRRLATVETSFPLAGIIGLAIGGPALFAILTVAVVLYLRRKDRYKRQKLQELEEASRQNNVPLRTIRIPMRVSQRSSFNPFPSRQVSLAMSNERLEDESMMDSPPMTKAQARRLSQKGSFHIPSIRDSWPLAASMPNVPLRLLQTNSSMVTLNQVGGGGYVVPLEQPKWPGRTYSRKSKTKIVVSAEKSNMQRFSESSPDIPPKRPPHQRRSASVSQLSTILRSTSQRLKAAHRKSLSRTLTTFGGSAGSPPTHKPATPSKAASQSREGLIEPDCDDAETVASSIFDANFNPSPSPTNKSIKNTSQDSLRRRSSVTPSAESIDSLCAGADPDLVIPAALASPSKKLSENPQRHAIVISSVWAKDLSAMMHGEDRASALELGTQGLPEEKAVFTSPHRISLASDPFYSAVKSGKRAEPHKKIIGPRPLYIRKTTFGQEATAERPASFVSTSSSPLRYISGNVQSSSSLVSVSSSLGSESNANPFSWDPEPLITSHQQNPSRAGSRRKGHNRSNVVRISLLPRPPYVSPLPEDPEEDSSSLKLKLPPISPTRFSDPPKSPSPRPSSVCNQRLSSRPPSISVFNPVLSIPELSEGQRDNANDSPTLGFDSSPQNYSPTLSVYNYYSEGHTSEDDFFNAKPIGTRERSLSKSRHQKEPTTATIPRPDNQELFSFPPLTVNTSPNLHFSFLPPRSSTAPPSCLTPPTLLKSPQSLPAPPVLTHSPLTPSDLNGPRSASSKSFSPSFGPRDSLLHQSICLLRRMNSEVSRCSTISNDEEEGRSPPFLPNSYPRHSTNWGRQFKRQSRGSKAYLSMGMGDSQKRSRKYKTGRRDLIAEQHKVEEQDEEDGKDEWKPAGLETMGERTSESRDLTPEQVKQEEAVEDNLTLPSLTSQGESETPNEQPTRKDSLTIELVTPTSPSTASPLKVVRWSDATPSPTIRVIRHESQLLQPSPQSPPRWGWSKSNLGKDAVEGTEDIKENLVHSSPTKKRGGTWNNNFERPVSLGLYDADGFLMSSPERETAASA